MRILAGCHHLTAMTTRKLFILFAASTIMTSFAAGCPSGDYDLGQITGHGGPPGSGGITHTGGTAGNSNTGGGAAASGNAGNVVTFANGAAQGAMTGRGWVALGTKTTITDPTCDADKHPMTDPCATINWSSSGALCISGSIAAVQTQDDYVTNWGVQVGVSATEPTEGSLGQAFSSVTFTFTGMPMTGVRAQVHRKGDPDSTQYCAYVTSGTSVPLATFSTECWDPALGTYLAPADVPTIDKIGLQISSAATPMAVQDFCMTRIDFEK